MRLLRSEQGFILATVMVVLLIVVGIGTSVLYFANGQQKAATNEQAREIAFDVAEAALNAQVGQLAREWPSTSAKALPSACTPSTSTSANACPSVESLTDSYPRTGTCSKGTEPWGSSLSNKWTTYVRDDASQSAAFVSATEQTQPSWDSNGNGKLWVRSVGVFRCTEVSLVTLVSRELQTIPFPRDAASGSWFKITNSGKKVIVNTEGEPPVAQHGEISMRCASLPPGGSSCEEWKVSKEQIKPNTTKAPALASPLMTEAQVNALKATAKSNGTFYTSCPSSLSGAVVYVEGCPAISVTGNGVYNSASSPGFLLLAEGTLSLGGGATYYGAIYARNPTNSSAALVTLGGTAAVVGAIDVDGNGGIYFGSSAENLVYSPTAITELKASTGAAATRNTFRVLPYGQ